LYFCGKELDRMHGQEQYDFSARWYDYALQSFTTPDPHAENHYSESPYSYCGDDPVNRIDPTGLDWYKPSNNNCVFKHHPRTDKSFVENGVTWTWYTNQGFTYTDNQGKRFKCESNGGVTQVFDIQMPGSGSGSGGASMNNTITTAILIGEDQSKLDKAVGGETIF
jgi:RHS repeat-associated protein